MKDIPHVELVRKKVGPNHLKILKYLFSNSVGSPPSVVANRLRADHPNWIETLDSLERRHALIERTTDHANYLIRCYALPLIDDPKALRLLERMDQFFSKLKVLYKTDLDKRQSVKSLLAEGDGKNDEKLEALFYLSGCHSIWSGKSINFPYSENSSLTVSESVLRFEGLADILNQYFEWHYVNSDKGARADFLAMNDSYERRIGFLSESVGTGAPEWYEQLDDTKKALIREIDTALKNRTVGLATMGLRTLIDIVMTEKLGDIGGFSQKLRAFQKEEYATRRQKEVLELVLDVGHAAAHRAYFPDMESIETCVHVVKHLIEGVYIVDPKVRKMAEKTPARDDNKNKFNNKEDENKGDDS